MEFWQTNSAKKEGVMKVLANTSYRIYQAHSLMPGDPATQYIGL